MGTRFSGAEWYDESMPDVLIVGVGGIGSWTALNLARIGFPLLLQDGDIVDETNVQGGQMYTDEDIGDYKTQTVASICRGFGARKEIFIEFDDFTEDDEIDSPIVITGLDNMAARKLVYEKWKEMLKNYKVLGLSINECILIDGRLTMEMSEIICIRGDDEQAMKEYEEKYLFSDEEANEALDCTTKQSTFGAMNIASLITALLCNFIANNKLGYEARVVPFYTRMHLPSMEMVKREVICQTV